jgi:hypothetical protein
MFYWGYCGLVDRMVLCYHVRFGQGVKEKIIIKEVRARDKTRTGQGNKAGNKVKEQGKCQGRARKKISRVDKR